jgi:hypothetical protein
MRVTKLPLAPLFSKPGPLVVPVIALIAARRAKAFSSQVASLGGSENAIGQVSIFKPSGFTWRLGKCDQAKT